jgi:hypothetical protein
MMVSKHLQLAHVRSDEVWLVAGRTVVARLFVIFEAEVHLFR